MRLVLTIAVALAWAGAASAQQPPQQQQPPQGRGDQAQPGQPGRGGRGAQPAQPAAGQPPANQTPAAPAKPEPPKLNTKFITAKDGTKIAYDVQGTGPALMLLHGAGQTRRDWHDSKYVNQLSVGTTVITVDLRGHGESDKPTRPESYALDRVLDDLTAVADAAGVDRFHVWGFNYGATIGRYLAARSPRVRSLVYAGMGFGPAMTDPMRAAISGMKARWQPIIDAHHKGEINSKQLSEQYRAALEGNIPLTVAKMGAMMDYPPLEPAELKVPTLWVVGSQDPDAMASMKAYEAKLQGTQVTLALMDNLTHGDVFHKADAIFPKVLGFIVKQK